MPFRNRVRLPVKLTAPQYTEEREVYRRADGVSITQSVVIHKIYEGSTDFLNEILHERLKIALAHDEVVFENDKYFGDVAQIGAYDINWQEKFDYPFATAKFKAEVSPFNASNSNCQTCEEATQLNLVDDTYPSPLAEGSTTLINAIANDDICCYPVVFSITTFNADFVSAMSINLSGVVSTTLKTPLQDSAGIKLGTYRATCANGGYDEADIFADIDGSIAGCLAPHDLTATIILNDGANLAWMAPYPAPSGGYHWQIYKTSNLGLVVFEGDTMTLGHLFTAVLEPGTEYIFFVRSICASSVSNYISVQFTTTGAEGTVCGRYNVFYNNPTEPGTTAVVTYTDCTGIDQSKIVPNGISRDICALENSPGNPVKVILSKPPIYMHYTYDSPC